MAVDLCLGLEADALAPLAVLRRAEVPARQHHRLGHAAHGEIAVHPDVLAVRLDAPAAEGDLRVLGGVEEVVGAEVLVAPGVAGMDAGGLDRHLHGALVELVGLGDDAAGPLPEGPAHAADQVADPEGQLGVRRVDPPGRGRGGDPSGRGGGGLGDCGAREHRGEDEGRSELADHGSLRRAR